VQVAEVREDSVAGVQLTAEIVGAATSASEKLRLPPASAPVMIAAASAVMLPAVAVNVAAVAPAGTTTVAGTATAAWLDAAVTVLPPAGAGLDSDTVQRAVPPEETVCGLHASADRLAGAQSVSPVDTDAPFRVAVMTAGPSPVTRPALQVKLAETEPAGTTAEGGTLTAAWFVERATETPPAGAGWGNVTVQFAVEEEDRSVGVQLSEETTAEAAKASENDLALPFSVAVSSAFPPAVIAPAAAENVPEAVPSGTAIAAGTVTAGLSLLMETLAPPPAAGLLSVTVQLAAAAEFRTAGVQ
jgi:hypothetical protein